MTAVPPPVPPEMPPLGCVRPMGTRTCGYGSDVPRCDQPASWHLLWDGQEIENSLACDEHRDMAHERWHLHDEHPVGEMCAMPGSVVVWSWEEPPGGCLWHIDDPELVAEANGERDLERVR